MLLSKHLEVTYDLRVYKQNCTELNHSTTHLVAVD